MKRLKIAFHVNEINYRGTTTPIVDYIRHLRLKYNFDGIIISTEVNAPCQHHPLGVQLCRQNNVQFFRYGCREMRKGEPAGFHENTDRIIKQQNCDLLYIMKAGDRPDDRLSKIVPNICHGWRGVPFEGDAIAATSRCGARNGRGTGEYVPTIIEPNNVKSNLRNELKIPANATVFGNLGGEMVFNIGVAWRVMYRLAKERPNFYFIFMGINTVIDRGSMDASPALIKEYKKLKNVIWLPPALGDRKYAFINTCDAMLHARKQGEMGGSAVAEFSLSNKPVITAMMGRGGHRDDLQTNPLCKTMWYRQEDEILYEHLKKFNRDEVRKKNWVAPIYRERHPDNAIRVFYNHFIKPFEGRFK